MQLQENTLFANRYTLQKLLGRGGFSEVWLAKDNWTHLLIALKVYAPGQGMDANGLQEFCGELASVYDLNHQNLLKPQHVDTWENMPYLIIAYCSHGSCGAKIGKMSEQEMWKFIHDVATGLAYLHSKEVVHQDIKPDNILIDDAGNYLITDFGVSTRARTVLRKSVVFSSARDTTAMGPEPGNVATEHFGGNTAGGTLAYMGPERFSKQPAPTKASDIWSFGAMCYELLDGQVPFGEIGGGMQKGGAEIPTLQAQVSDALKYTITKMLQNETWDRPTAATLVEWAKNPAAIDIDYALLEEGPTPREPLKLSPKTKKVQAAGDTIVVKVHNSTAWMVKVKDLPDWVHYDTKTDNQFSLKIDKNTTNQSRTCEVRVSALNNSETETLTISQASLPKNNNWVKWVVGIAVVLLAILGICAYVDHQEEVRAINNNHNYFVAAFDENVQKADIDHIESLELAVDILYEIQMIERDSKFNGSNVYSSKRNTLIQKMQNMYDEVDRKYQKAPAGTQTERRNYEKREKIKQIKARI